MILQILFWLGQQLIDDMKKYFDGLKRGINDVGKVSANEVSKLHKEIKTIEDDLRTILETTFSIWSSRC